MYFARAKELEELNKKIAEGLIDTTGFSRDQAANAVEGPKSSSLRSTKKQGDTK